jgi:hypothetical protein
MRARARGEASPSLLPRHVPDCTRIPSQPEARLTHDHFLRTDNPRSSPYREHVDSALLAASIALEVSHSRTTVTGLICSCALMLLPLGAPGSSSSHSSNGVSVDMKLVRSPANPGRSGGDVVDAERRRARGWCDGWCEWSGKKDG